MYRKNNLATKNFIGIIEINAVLSKDNILILTKNI